MQGVDTVGELVEVRCKVGRGQRDEQLGVIGVLLLIDAVGTSNAGDWRGEDSEKEWPKD